MADDKTIQAATAKAPKFKNNATQAKHPLIGVLTVDHLKNPIVIAGIKKYDEKQGKTWYKDNIED
jgi:hypothetical protein